MAALLTQGREKPLTPGIRALDYDHAVLAKPPFLFTTRGIEVGVVLPELAEDLRLTVPVIAELRALDLQEIAESLVGMLRVRNVEDRVRMHCVFEIGLPPRIAEPLCRTKPLERDVEGCYLQLVVERADGMFVERLCGQSEYPFRKA